MNRCVLTWAVACGALCLLTVASGSAQAQITTDLHAYWNMNGDLDDAIDSTHDGTLLSTSGGAATFAAGKFDQAVDLDRADVQRVQIGDATNEADFDFVGGTISISAWFTVESFDTSWQALIAKGESTSWRVARRSGSSVMSYAGGVGDIPTDDTTGPDVTGGDWHHLVAITENGVSTRLWVDGGLVATGGAPGITDNNANPMLIGDNPDTSGRSWNGMIDDVAIWTRAITEAEINTIWNNGTGQAIGNIDVIYLATDFNQDTLVNTDDYDILAANFLTAGDGSQGDANGDGFIDLDDFVKWRADNENPGIPHSSAGSAVPEPSAILLGLLFAGMLAATRTARRRFGTVA